MIDVQQGSLRPLKHDIVPAVQCLVQENGSIRDKGRKLFRGASVVLVHLLRIERFRAEESMRDGVLFMAGVVDVRAKKRGVEEIHHPQAIPMNFILVCGADAPACGANRRTSRGRLGGKLNHAVIRKNYLGTIRDEQLPIDRKTSILELLDLGKKRHGVKDYTVAYDAPALGPEHTAGYKLQNELLAFDNDRMACIVAAGVPRNNTEALRKHVDDLAFALVAPLGAEDYR